MVEHILYMAEYMTLECWICGEISELYELHMFSHEEKDLFNEKIVVRQFLCPHCRATLFKDEQEYSIMWSD